MPCNEATNRNDKASLKAQSPTPRCTECEGHGRVLSTRNLKSLDSGHLEWQPCEGCHGTGLANLNPNVRPEGPQRSYNEE
jgi:DnaJ-class molecular chaperone